MQHFSEKALPEKAPISVVIPFHGDPHPASTLVHELQQQTLPVSEIIVSDDVSPQPFPETPGVTVVRRQENGGFGSAVNSGVQAASAELLLVLNSDLHIGPTFIAELMQQARPLQPAVISPALQEPRGLNRVARVWPRRYHYVFAWIDLTNRLIHNEKYLSWFGTQPVSETQQDLCPADWVVGAVMLMPRQEFLAVGGFDEVFFMNSEETDLQRRLKDRGVPAYYAPMVRVHHESGGSSPSSIRRQWLVEGWFRYQHKWGQPQILLAELTAASLVNSAWELQRKLRGMPVNPLRKLREEMQIVTSAYCSRGA